MNKLQNSLKALALVLIITGLFSCDGRKWDADTSHIKAEVEVRRFDSALFAIDSIHFGEDMQQLLEEYPELSRLLIERIIGFGQAEDPRVQAIFGRKFLFDPYIRDSLYSVVRDIYTHEEIEELEKGFEGAFKRVKYYLQVDTLPTVSTIITAFGYKAFTYENHLAISLDMFLGDAFKFYPSLDFPDYQIKRMKKEYILPEALRTYFMSLYDEKVDQTLLSNMIYAGKQLFFLDVVAPEMPDTLKIGYTKVQLAWAKDNEPEMWNHLTTNELVYTTDQNRIDKYIVDAPYTIDEGVPPESAPRLGEYTGWQIVKAYMEENPAVSLQELFLETDYRKILKESKYRPRL